MIWVNLMPALGPARLRSRSMAEIAANCCGAPVPVLLDQGRFDVSRHLRAHSPSHPSNAGTLVTCYQFQYQSLVWSRCRTAGGP